MFGLNLFTCTFQQCKDLSQMDSNVEIRHNPMLACIPASMSDFGMFPVSTLTLLFQEEDREPVRIVERVYRKDCTGLQYWRYLQLMRHKIKTITHEYGYSLEFTQTHSYFDYVHTKEDLLEWAISNLQLVRSPE